MKYPLVFILFISFPCVSQKLHTPFEKGESKNGSRIGVWEYFDKPALPGLVIDYDKGHIVHVEPDTADFFVKRNGQWVREKLSVPTRPHMSKLIMLDHFQKRLAFMQGLVNMEREFEAYLTFEVSPEGVAINPKITPPTMGTIERELLELFKTSPNFWIAGIDQAGNPVTTQMAFGYRLCKTECEPSTVKNLNAHVIATFESIFARKPDTKEKLIPSFDMPIENYGLQFSPDESQLLFETRYLDLKVPFVNDACMVNISDHQFKKINFATVQNCYWISSNQINFKYGYGSILRNREATYSKMNGEITVWPDSIKSRFFPIPNTSLTKLSYAQNEQAGVGIFIQDLITKSVKHLKTESTGLIAPIGWSNTDQFLVYGQTAAEKEKVILLDIHTGEENILPVLNCRISGWTTHDESVYLLHKKPGDYNVISTLYRYQINDKTLHPVAEDWKGVYDAQYNASSGLFILNKEGVISIWNGNKNSKVIELTSRGKFATWSRSGKYVAYVDYKEHRLMLYNTQSNTTTRLVVWDKSINDLVSN